MGKENSEGGREGRGTVHPSRDAHHHFTCTHPEGNERSPLPLSLPRCFPRPFPRQLDGLFFFSVFRALFLSTETAFSNFFISSLLFHVQTFFQFLKLKFFLEETGEDKLIAVARHIAKTLGRTETMTDDIAALEITLKSLDRQISHYVSADQPIWSDSADSAAFLDAVDDLLATIQNWDPMAREKHISACLDRADDLLQQSMFRLEDEFRLLMERGGEAFDLNRMYGKSDSQTYFSSDLEEEEDDLSEVVDDVIIPVAQPVTDFDVVIDALPSGTISDLHEIAKRMVAAGFGKECAHVYSICRRDFLEESLSRLGLQKLSNEEAQKMAWTELEDEIERWMKAMTVALRILFPSERRLCDRVFFGLSSAADLSFMEVCRGSAIQLLNFADAVAIGSRSPERLFKILDVFETLRDLMPEFEEVFSDHYCAFLQTEAATIRKRLGETIRGIFMELENLIRRDPAKDAVPGGGLHPITRYVMNYLRAACGSHKTLEQVFQENGDWTLSASSSSLSVQISWIMELLESNLEVKSKVYNSPALSSIFLMNNVMYIVQKVKDSEMGPLLGDDWIRKHSAKLRQLHVNYQRSSWSKILAALKFDNSSSDPNFITKILKEKIKTFNADFEYTCRSQSTWLVLDELIRAELRVSVTESLLLAYRNFLGRLHSVPELGRVSDKYVKYSVEDVKGRINELLQGNVGSFGGRK